MKKQKIRTVTCFGSGLGKPGEPIYDSMEKVGALLADRGAVVVTGAYGGAGMEAPIKGAKEAKGRVRGYHLGRHSAIKPNAHFEKTELHDMSLGPLFVSRWNITSTYAERLGKLLQSDAFVFAGGMGPGTLVELLAVINLNKGMWKKQRRIAIVHPQAITGSKGSLWEPYILKDRGILDALDGMVGWDAYLRIVRTPREAVDWVTRKRL